MDSNKTWTGFVLLAMAAAIGAWLVFVPGWLANQYERIADAGPVWGWIYLTVVGIGVVLLSGSTFWIIWKLWVRQRNKQQVRESRARSPGQMSSQEQHSELRENLSAIDGFRGESDYDDELKKELDPRLKRFAEKELAERLEIVAFGTVSSGKSALLNLLAGSKVFQSDARGGTTIQRNEIPWPGHDQVILVDTPGLGEVEGEKRVAEAALAARDADLVLLVIDGPLREHETRLCDKLSEMEKRVLVCLNKGDWYQSDDQLKLASQIRSQLGKWLEDEQDLVMVQAAPVTRTRVRVSADGRELTEEVEVPPQIDELSNRMLKVVEGEGKSLLLANLLWQSRGLLEDAKQAVRTAIDRRAWKVVERYTWGAGGAAALSPFPVVDLVTGCAISTKMVMELAKVYRQDVDLELAISLLGQLGKNLVSILGVSVATPAVTSIVASMLKAVPGVGTLAGGLMQGAVQALITRWIGAIFITYLRNEMEYPDGGLAGLARRQWNQMTTAKELRRFIAEARQNLRS